MTFVWQSPVEYVLSIVMFAVIPSLCGAADGHISVQVVNQKGDVTPIRAWVEVNGRQLFQPTLPDTATPYARDRSFSCDGHFTMTLPAGRAVVHVERGKEFVPLDIDVEIVSGETLEKQIRIDRWIDMPREGWYSADLHVHLGHDDPRILKQLALADDVHLIPSFTYWLRGRGETWEMQWPGDEFNQPLLIDDHHIITRNNIEIERIDGNAAPGAAIGATFLFNLNQPVTAMRYGEHFPTDAELCRVARRHSPRAVFDSDKPSWAESVIGVALGMLDTIQVCHNHYHRTTTLPGGWGMIGPLASGETNAAAGDGLFHRTNSLYYRFLNCGFRLGVSGGSAIGVMSLPTGYNRVYAHVEGKVTADKLWAAISDGRTFATSGPMLTLTANNETVGGTIDLRSNQSQVVSIRTTVRAIERLESLQIIHDGRIVASQELLQKAPDPIMDSELTFTLTPKRSGWIAARALFRAPDGLLRQAHTSPIYVSIDEKPAASGDDARYMLRWVDRLAAIAKSHPDHFPDTETQQATLAIYAEASARYEQIIEQAKIEPRQQ
ncbi:MAG: CehA/McbA family metallohydrolase [Fuerstiella sp.]|nr:CehA/McbA family metallohydrolase [Fuerstiella sp.]MCP4854937.1 CehA/McbA family metallohydrolase [Fuerstiella sp.]